MLGWIWGLLFAPQDAVQGNSYRIIFLHVPSVIFAELNLFLYGCLCINASCIACKASSIFN